MRDWQITGAIVPYSFRAARFEVAVMVALTIGSGQYGLIDLTPKGEPERMPGRVGKPEIGKWIKKRFGMTPKEFTSKAAKQFPIELIHALESVKIGLPGEGGILPPRNNLEPKAHRAAENIKAALAQNLNRAHIREADQKKAEPKIFLPTSSKVQ